MEDRLKLQIEQLNHAVENMRDSFGIELENYDELVRDSIKSGQIQKFEVSIELFWKTLRRFLVEMHSLELNSPKAVIKKGLEIELYSYSTCETVLSMLDWRNELSHMYKKEHFEDLRERIVRTDPVWDTLLSLFGDND